MSRSATSRKRPASPRPTLTAEQVLKTVFVHGDMAEEATCQKLVERAVEVFGRVDCLVNNAFAFTAKARNATTADGMRSFTAGPPAFARIEQQVCPHLQAAGGGAIVSVSSISGHIAQKDRWTYNAAKGAVNQLTKCQALDLAPFNIRVNSVAPGWIWTNETDKAANGWSGRLLIHEVHQRADGTLGVRIPPQVEDSFGRASAVKLPDHP